MDLLRSQEADGYVLLGLTALFSGSVIVLLLQAIRPSHAFGIKTGVSTLRTHGLVWPTKSLTKDFFLQLVRDLTEEMAVEELRGVIFVTRQLIERKYMAYRWALLVAKVQAVIIFLAMFIVSLFRAISP